MDAVKRFSFIVKPFNAKIYHFRAAECASMGSQTENTFFCLLYWVVCPSTKCRADQQRKRSRNEETLVAFFPDTRQGIFRKLTAWKNKHSVIFRKWYPQGCRLNCVEFHSLYTLQNLVTCLCEVLWKSKVQANVNRNIWLEFCFCLKINICWWTLRATGHLWWRSRGFNIQKRVARLKTKFPLKRTEIGDGSYKLSDTKTRTDVAYYANHKQMKTKRMCTGKGQVKQNFPFLP